MTEFVDQHWPLLLPTVLGGLAVYWLLPRANRFPPAIGAVLAGLALVSAGWLIIRSEWAVPEAILFYTFAGLAVLFGGLMITQRNPVHAALSFAMVVLSTCGLFLLQAAPFLMAATIIIYAGAIVVTFLFVIMLAQQAGLSSADQRSREPFLATLAGFVLLGSLFYVLDKSYSGPFRDKLDVFIERTEQAVKADKVKQWQEIFGVDDAFFKDFRRFAVPTNQIRSADPARSDLAMQIESTGVSWKTFTMPGGEPREVSSEQTEAFKHQLRKIHELALQVQQTQGSLTPRTMLSRVGVDPADNPIPLGPNGKPVERLPAANVAALGKLLFTDYLLAVELAGTLLLIATIGAIAIAGRQGEGLR